METLPHGLVLRRKEGPESVSNVQDLTLLETSGFMPLVEADSPGGYVSLVIFKKKVEATVYLQAMLDMDGLRDRDSAVTERVRTKDGTLHVIIVHHFESDDDDVRVFDYTSGL